MKIITQLLLILTIVLPIYNLQLYAEGKIEIINIDKIKEVSMTSTATGNITEDITDRGKNILQTLKIILQGLMIIYIVYIGITMIIAMGSDDEKLTKSKNQIWYMLVALIFINIPNVIYSAFKDKKGNITQVALDGGEGYDKGESINFLVNYKDFWGEKGFLRDIVSFLEVFIFGGAIFVIIMAGLNMMSSRGRDEKISEAKNKIIYSLFALIFVGFIEIWKKMAFTGKLSYVSNAEGTGIFNKIFSLALLFAGPVAIFFLTLGGYYYISSNGDDDKIKKGKSIIINTMFGVLLLLIMMLFLNDLSDLL